MKLLLDENLPVKLKYRFLEKGIKASTVNDEKWNSKQNGELLQEMISQQYTHLVTFDSNISFQQNFTQYPIPVIVILAYSNNYEVIMEVFDDLLKLLNDAVTGPNIIMHPGRKK